MSLFSHGLRQQLKKPSMTTIEEMNSEMTRTVLPVTIIVATFTVFGFFGNSTVLYVYTTKYPRCNFKYFVVCLCAIDFISCLTTLPGEVFTQLHWYLYPSAIVCKIKSFFNAFTVCASALTLLLIAVDRYLKVCWPYKKQISHVVAKGLCISVIFVSIFPALPVPFFWGLHSDEILYKGSNVTAVVCEIDEKYIGSQWPALWVKYVYITPNSTIMGASAILYLLVAISLFRGRSKLSRHITVPSKKHYDNCSDNYITPSSSQVPNQTLSSDCCMAEGKNDIRKISDIHVVPFMPMSPACGNPIAGEIAEVNSDMDQGETNSNSGHSQDSKPINGIDLNLSLNTMNRRQWGSESNESLNKIPTSKTNGLTNGFLDKLKHKGDDMVASSGEDMRLTKTVDHTCANGNMTTKLMRRTLIVFLLTVVFVLTTSTYFALIQKVAQSSKFQGSLSPQEQTVVFFFYRFYFVNSIINPIIYGIWDPRFRQVIRRSFKRLSFKQRNYNT